MSLPQLFSLPQDGEMDTSHDPQQLAKCHAHWRRVYNRIWLALTLMPAVGGVIVWSFTRNIEHLYSGLFVAIFPLIGLLYNHFVLLNPRRDPLTTQQRLEDLYEKQQINARTVALVNGLMLLIASPVLVIFGVSAGAEYGIVGMVIGGMIGSIGCVGGLLCIAWSRRHN